MPNLRHPLALFVCLSGGLAWTGSASAAGFATARFGAEHGTPVATNPTAIYYNPSAIALSEGVHIFLDGTLALRSASYTHELTSSDDNSVPGANAGEATLLNFAAAPMLGASAKLGDLALGVGVYVPFGGSAVWDANTAFEDSKEAPGAYDGVQRWHAIDGAIQSLYSTITVAYHFRPIGLSVGLSGNLIRSSVETIRARNGDGSNAVGIEGRSAIDVSGFQGSFGVGATWEAMPEKLWVAASYQSRPNVVGGMNLKGTLKNYFNGRAQPDVEVELQQDLPDIFRLGARFKPTKDIELRLFGDYTRWSAMENQCLVNVGSECVINDDGSAKDPANTLQNVARRWDDTFGVRAGASYWPAPTAELFGGLGYDGNAVPDETLDPSSTDFHDVSIAAGGRFALTKQLHLAASYTHIFYVGRDTTGKSITATGLVSPSVTPDSGGEYSQTIGVLNVNLDVAF